MPLGRRSGTGLAAGKLKPKGSVPIRTKTLVQRQQELQRSFNSANESPSQIELDLSPDVVLQPIGSRKVKSPALAAPQTASSVTPQILTAALAGRAHLGRRHLVLNASNASAGLRARPNRSTRQLVKQTAAQRSPEQGPRRLASPVALDIDTNRVQRRISRMSTAGSFQGALLQSLAKKISGEVVQDVRKAPAAPRSVRQAISALRRYQSTKFSQPSLLKLVTGGGNSVQALQVILGIREPIASADVSTTQAHPAVLVSIDVESERRGLIDHVIEVGITTLDARDISGIDPGVHLENWSDKMKHHHLIIEGANRIHQRQQTSLFGLSRVLSASAAREAIIKILQSLSPSPLADLGSHMSTTVGARSSAPPKLYLVGHSVGGDLKAIAREPLKLDISSASEHNILSWAGEYDTNVLSVFAASLGARWPGNTMQLGYLLPLLGCHPRFIDAGARVKGWHNSSNDAAYSMMALLLYATRWDEIITQQSTPEVHNLWRRQLRLEVNPARSRRSGPSKAPKRRSAASKVSPRLILQPNQPKRTSIETYGIGGVLHHPELVEKVQGIVRNTDWTAKLKQIMYRRL